MADSFQHEVPKARINLKLALHTGGAQKKVELPLKLLTVGDFSNGKENRPLSERKKINVNKNNFNSVLSEFNPEVNLTVPNTMAVDGSEESIKLNFSDIKDLNLNRLPARSPSSAPCWPCVIYYATSNPIFLITPLSEKNSRKFLRTRRCLRNYATK